MPTTTSPRSLSGSSSFGSDPYRLELKSSPLSPTTPSCATAGHSVHAHVPVHPHVHVHLHAHPHVHPHSGHSRVRVAHPRIWGVIVLLGVLYVAFYYDVSLREPQLRASVWFSEYRSAFNQKVTPPLDPNSTVILDTEIFYMLPSPSSSQSQSPSPNLNSASNSDKDNAGTDKDNDKSNSDPKVKGLFLFFHGCSHSGQDLFRLPEERVMAMTALRRGLAVVSITSADRETGCWSQEDVIRLSKDKVIEAFLYSINLPATLPRIAMGTSSGGSILFSAYEELKFSSMASYIIPDGFSTQQLLEGLDANGKVSLPPTAFVHMTRDKHSMTSMHKQASALKSLGVSHQVFEVRPHPFTSQLCDRRLPEIGDRRCQSFLQRVHDHYPGLLDKDNHVLKPYSSGDWKAVFEDSKLDDELRHFIGAPPTPKGQASPLQFSGHSWSWAAMMEEIEVSYAEHEMTCQHRNQVLDFLMTNAGIESFVSESKSDGRRRGLVGILSQQK